MKDSAVGPIPANWTVRSLSDLCIIRSGGTPPKSDTSHWSGDVPWVSGKDLKAARLADVTDHITQDAADTYSKIAPTGSVLVLVRGMGLVNGFALSLIERPMAFNQDLKALIPRNGLSGAYLMYALTFAGQRMLRNVVDAAHGTKRLTQDDLDTFELAVPPFEEQVRIAAVLARAERSIAVEDRTLATLASLKRAAMTALFTRGLHGERLKETEVGLIPRSWTVVTINDVALATQYGLSVRGQSHGQFPILRMNCQDDGRVVFRDLQYVDLDRQVFTAFRLNDGDLLFNRTNSFEHVGRMAIVDGDREAVFASYLIRLKLDTDRCLPRYLNYYMNRREVQRDIRRLASRAVGQANINATKLRTIAFPLPENLDEQREIVAVIDAIDRNISVHERKYTLQAALLRSLLHALMKGEIGVDELNLAVVPSGREQEATA